MGLVLLMVMLTVAVDRIAGIVPKALALQSITNITTASYSPGNMAGIQYIATIISYQYWLINGGSAGF